MRLLNLMWLQNILPPFNPNPQAPQKQLRMNELKTAVVDRALKQMGFLKLKKRLERNFERAVSSKSWLLELERFGS